ncbi:glycosyl hydrolase family 18 protein [Salinibius halmophilus]|uniref:glycosyl hydrolase family 18 protein n=1 Tax=Salinibius halmophilus TaxID=1853216 RepID=UPI000E66C22D|nr:glycosyl hydrolase family 18 protein [Salinibius halmophilus]
MRYFTTCLMLCCLSTASVASIIGYFPNWSAYRDETTLLDVDARELDVLVYNSAVLQANGTIVASDPFADLSIEQVTSGQQLIRGNFNAVRALQADYPELKIVLSIGGWNGSRYISSVLASPESQARLIQSWLTLKEKYGFAGLELDWQYPLDGGDAENTNHPNDLVNLQVFASAYKAACESCTLMLTLGAGSHVRERWPFDSLRHNVDYFVLHASSFNGSWSGHTGHIAPLFANPNRPTLSIDRAVKQLTDSGLPRRQLVLQFTTVGAIWQGVNQLNNGLYQPASSQKVFGTWDNEFTGPTGNIAYREIIEQQDDWQYFWDEAAQVSYLYSPQTEQFISYESKASLAEKLAYVSRNNLAGVGFWDIEGDSEDGLIAFAFRYWRPWQGLAWRMGDHIAFYGVYYLSALLILLTGLLSRYYWRRYQTLRVELIFHQQWHIWLQQVPQQMSSLAYFVTHARPEVIALPAPLVEHPARIAQQLEPLVDDPWQRLTKLSDELVAPWQADELTQQLLQFLAGDQRFGEVACQETKAIASLTDQELSLDIGDQLSIVVRCKGVVDDEVRRYLQQLQCMVRVARVNAQRILAQPQLLSELSKIACRREKIRYIKAENGYSGIYADDLKRPEFITTRLRYLVIHFPSLFISPHRSFLVVASRVDGVMKQGVKYSLLVGNDQIPIARSQLAELRQKYPHWFANTTEQIA